MKLPSLNRQSAVRLGIAGGVVALAAAAYVLVGAPGFGSVRYFLANMDAETFREEIQGFGPWAPLASIGLMLVHTYVVFPFELLAVANGLVFGAWGGIAITWVSMVLSSWLGYATAYYARPVVFRLVPGDRLVRAENWVRDRSPWQLAAIRLVPAVSFSLLNLVLGLLRVPFWRFTWTTAIGILPITVASVLFGHFLTLGPWGWAFLAAVVALGLGGWYLWRRQAGRRAAAQKTGG